jgi:hypothetical protein
MKHLFKFENFSDPEWKEVNQDEWDEFYIKNKRLPIDSKDLKKLGINSNSGRFREGDTYLMMEINLFPEYLFDVTSWIEKFEDEWWSVCIEYTYGENTLYICDGIDSVLDLIQKLKTNKGNI